MIFAGGIPLKRGEGSGWRDRGERREWGKQDQAVGKPARKLSSIFARRISGQPQGSADV